MTLYTMRRGSHGFTLVEMMITIGIIAILASIAYPSYVGSVKKSRRVEAQAALQQVATLEEQYFSETGSYTTDLTELGLGGKVWNETENKFYRFRVAPPTRSCPIASCYALVAIPANEQTADKWQFKLWSNGRKQRRQGTSGGWKTSWEI